MMRKALKKFHPLIVVFVMAALRVLPASAESTWDVAAEITRLRGEVPHLDAFEGAEGVVWHSSYSYDLMADGTTRKTHHVLMLLDESAEAPGITSYTIPFPYAEGAEVAIDTAAWCDPRTGGEISALPMTYHDENGLRYYRTEIPKEARGNVLVFDYTSTNPMRYYLDDVIELAGELPIWEQFVNVEIPSDMDLYWEGVGVRSPERQKETGVEKIKWTILNQHAWKNDGIVNERRPTLLFSLQRGLVTHLKNLSVRAASFKAPAVPPAAASSKGNLKKACESIRRYTLERELTVGGYPSKIVRNNNDISPDGPWTKSEQTLIAAKWLESLGWGVKVFWSQKIPVSASGPGSYALWDEPVLVISQGSGKGDVYFTSDAGLAFGKLPLDLYGAAVYRLNDSDLERLVLPKGSASENSLSQMWRLELNESGIVSGTLDLTVTGGWVDIMETGRSPELQDATNIFREKLSFPIPGIEFEAKSLKPVGTGYRLTFGVSAKSGIVSGTDILLRLPGAVPACLLEIPQSGEAFSFRFPFVFEQNAVITTPSGYHAFMLPAKTENGDSKATVESSIVHWPKRRRAESNFKWTVRTAAVGETESSQILNQAKMAFAWPQTNIPLRK